MRAIWSWSPLILWKISDGKRNIFLEPISEKITLSWTEPRTTPEWISMIKTEQEKSIEIGDFNVIWNLNLLKISTWNWRFWNGIRECIKGKKSPTWTKERLRMILCDSGSLWNFNSFENKEEINISFREFALRMRPIWILRLWTLKNIRGGKDIEFLSLWYENENGFFGE